ncbi:unnamed protein product, partial [Owenia fusiformis]
GIISSYTLVSSKGLKHKSVDSSLWNMKKFAIIPTVIAFAAISFSNGTYAEVQCEEGTAKQKIEMICPHGLSLNLQNITKQCNSSACDNYSIPRSEWEPDLLRCFGQSSCTHQLVTVLRICFSCEQSVKHHKRDMIYINCEQGTVIEITATLSLDSASKYSHKVHYPGNKDERLLKLRKWCNGLSQCEMISSPGHSHRYEQILFKCILASTRTFPIQRPLKLHTMGILDTHGMVLSVIHHKRDMVYIKCEQSTVIKIKAALSFNRARKNSKVHYSGIKSVRLLKLKEWCDGLEVCELISSPGGRHKYEQILYQCVLVSPTTSQTHSNQKTQTDPMPNLHTKPVMITQKSVQLTNHQLVSSTQLNIGMRKASQVTNELLKPVISGTARPYKAIDVATDPAPDNSILVGTDLTPAESIGTLVIPLAVGLSVGVIALVMVAVALVYLLWAKAHMPSDRGKNVEEADPVDSPMIPLRTEPQRGEDSQ